MKGLLFLFCILSAQVFAAQNQPSNDSSKWALSLSFGKAYSLYFKPIPAEQNFQLDPSSVKNHLGTYCALNLRQNKVAFGLEFCAQNRRYVNLAPNPLQWYDISASKHSVYLKTWQFKFGYQFWETKNLKTYAEVGVLMNNMQNVRQYQFVKDTSINYYWHKIDNNEKVYRSTYWSAGLSADYNIYKKCVYLQAQVHVFRQSLFAKASNEMARTTFQLGFNVVFSELLKNLEKGITI